MQQWYIENRDGSVEQVYSARRPGATARKIARFGNLATEKLSAKGEWLPRDAAALGAAIDAGHDANHGPHRRSIDYAIKEIEARLILGTLQIDGLLGREAAMRGVAVEDLALAVLAKADNHGPELGRVQTKMTNEGE